MFHVVIKNKNESSWKCLFKNLSESELKESFVKPYNKGREIIVNSEIISPNNISHISIRHTNMQHREELKKVQAESYQ